jgi:hypothetical protein
MNFSLLARTCELPLPSTIQIPIVSAPYSDNNVKKTGGIEQCGEIMLILKMKWQ